MIDHAEVVDAMNRKYGPLYVQDVIPAKSYPGQDTPNQVATVWNILVAPEKLSDQVAYNIVKTIFDKKAEMVAVHREALNFDYRYQTNNASPIPFHPGAIKYFAEKGIKLK
jgi:TRAP transporter TAXI family solute receptor